MIAFERGGDAATMAFEALRRVYDTTVSVQTVLIKPNVGRVSSAGSGVCTDPEIVRGVIRFFASLGTKRIMVGDGSIWGVHLHEAMEKTGIKRICDEENVECIDLDAYGSMKVAIPQGVVVNELLCSAVLADVDCVISVPVMKTHMYTGVTLSIKNMKGCLYKMEKTTLHRLNKFVPDQTKGRVLDYGIADMATVLMPHYTVIDGMVGLEGLGPSVGTPKPLGIVLASKDALACDLAAMFLMGFELYEVPHLWLIRDAQQPHLTLETLTVDNPTFFKTQTPFKRALMENLEKDYPNIRVVEKGTCSACSAALMTFLRTHGDKFTDSNPFILATGKDLSANDFTNLQGETFFIGNCALNVAKKEGRPCCQGCPPIGSSILEFLQKHNV